GEERYQAPLTQDDHGEDEGTGHGEDVAVDGEHAAAPALGEAAAPALPAAEEGEEYHSTPPVVCATTWFEVGDPAEAEERAEGGAVADDTQAAGLFEPGFIGDGLSVMMLLTVTIISLLV